MQYTEYLGLKKPESADFYSVEDFNENAEKIDNRFKNLSNVDNTADFDKPMSNPQKEYIKGVEDSLKKDINDVANVTEMALNKITTHLSDKKNPHGTSKEDVGLGRVDNTSDLEKPVSVYQQKALEEVESKSAVSAIATGETITVTDSADAPVRKLKVDGKTEQVTTTGKNLFPTVNSSMVSDIYNTAPTIKENSITGGWAYKLNGFNESHAGCIFSVKLRHPDTTTTSRATFTFQAENNADLTAYHFNNEFYNNRLYSMVVPENATKVKIDYGKLSSTAELYDFQIEEGTVATEYEPYTNGASPNPDYQQDINGVGDSGEVEVTVTGKNLLQNVTTSKNINGIDYVINADGSISVKGTATALSTLYLNVNITLGKGNYKLSGCTNGSSDTFRLAFNWNDGADRFVTNATGETSFILNDDVTNATCSVRVTSGAKVDTTIYPMIRRIDDEDDTYEPYKSQTVSIPVSSPLYEGDSVTLKNGKLEYERKMEMVVFDGSDDEGWYVYYDNPYFYQLCTLSLRDKINKSGSDVVKCDYFIGTAYYESYDGKAGISVNPDSGALVISTNDFNDETEWKEWLSQNPITVVYELAEPSKETMGIDIDLSTYSHVTNITNSDHTNMEVEYFINSANGNAVGDLQEQVNEKVSVSYLRDFILTETFREFFDGIEVGEVSAKDILLDKDGYIPVMSSVATNISDAFCYNYSIAKLNDGTYRTTCYVKNIGTQLIRPTIDLTVLYVKAN